MVILNLLFLCAMALLTGAEQLTLADRLIIDNKNAAIQYFSNFRKDQESEALQIATRTSGGTTSTTPSSRSEMDIFTGEVEWDQLPKEHSHTSKFHLVKSAIPREDCEKLIALLSDVSFETDLDSVDDAAAFEYTLIAEDQLYDETDSVRKEVMRILKPAIEKRIQPVIEAAYPGQRLKPCYSFIRRYTVREDEERMRHLTHFDGQSYATFVVSLNTQGKDFHGGLYVGTANHKRTYLNLSAGDGGLHRSDLLHGVNVLNGTRWSMILWYSGPRGDCKSDPISWYKKRADDGNPIYQFLLGHRHTPWMKQSAESGFPMAQDKYGQDLLSQAKLQGSPEMEAEGIRWIEKAATLGDGQALFHAGEYYLDKSREVASDEEAMPFENRAASSFEKSCIALSLDGCLRLAQAVQEGRAGNRWPQSQSEATAEALKLFLYVSSPDSLWEAYQLTEDMAHLHRAAKMGHQEAQYMYGSYLLEQHEQQQEGGSDDAAAIKYLGMAAGNGHRSSRSLLQSLGLSEEEESEDGNSSSEAGDL